MRHTEAVELLRAAIGEADGEAWADLGAGGGTFTRALATLVGARGQVVAVDADERALDGLRRWAKTVEAGPEIVVISADISRPFALPIVDGAVMANVLHFMRDPAEVLARIASRMRPGGRMVVIEYEGRRPSRWVPYPVSAARLAELAADAGLTPPRIAATRASAFGGDLYVAVTAWADR
jgi:ubiquinone/menaquinone biosynthesis C-methylase UbiE